MRDSKLNVEECKHVVERVFGTSVLQAKGTNRFYIQQNNRIEMVYVSQTKPSRYGKGKWKYEFFHTFGVDVIAEIVDSGCNFILLDYIEGRKVRVELKDLFWLFQHNSRIKGKQKEWSLDIVVKEEGGEYFFTSYDQKNKEKRMTQLL